MLKEPKIKHRLSLQLYMVRTTTSMTMQAGTGPAQADADMVDGQERGTAGIAVPDGDRRDGCDLEGSMGDDCSEGMHCRHMSWSTVKRCYLCSCSDASSAAGICCFLSNDSPGTYK